MAYFNIKCCSPDISKLILLGLNILIACWSAVHLGYAGSFSVVKTKSLQYLALLPVTTTTVFQMKQAAILTNGPLAYYVVTGVVAMVVSCLLILVILEVIGNENRIFYFRLIASGLVVHLLMEFGAAIYSTITLAFYGLLFEVQINLSQDYIDIQPYQSVKDYFNGVRNFYNLSQAQAIFIWIFIIPSTVFMIFALFDEFVKGQDVEEPTKIAPQKIEKVPIQQKAKIYEKTQVESFGVQSFGANKSQEQINLKK